MMLATNSRAAPVAKVGMLWASGAINRQTRNSAAAVSAVSPVRPPASTPAALSTKLVVDEVPSTAPTAVALASDSRARRRRGKWPCSSSIPARFATPTRVPAVSKTSTSSSVRITLTMDRSRAARISSARRLDRPGGRDTTPLNSAAPVSQPNTAMSSMPITTEPAMRRALRAAISTNPSNRNTAGGCVRSPRPTKVTSSSTITPLPESAIMPRKKPMPAQMPRFSERGMASINHPRTGNTDSAIKIRPEINTAPRALCQLWPRPSTMP